MAKVLMNKNDKFLVKDSSKDYHTKYGFFKKEDLKKSGNAIKTTSEFEITFRKLNFSMTRSLAFPNDGTRSRA